MALLLAVCYVAIVMSTTTMGFTRDETFYFHHSKVYLNWVTKVFRAEGEERERLLGRGEVFDAWKNNSEHPPLSKMLFGASWKWFGTKRRPVDVKGDEFIIRELGLCHGFEPGDEVALLGPVSVGQDPRSAQRELGRLRIVERSPHRATAVPVDGFSPDEDVQRLCSVNDVFADGERVLATCEAETRHPMEFLSESDAFRFPGALLGGLLVFLVFLFSVQMGGVWVALVATVLMGFIPRLFFHAHLTCFDIPITAVSFLTLYGFSRSLNSTGWAVATGVFWGLALLTKLNSFFLPITLLLWWGLSNLHRVRRTGKWSVSLPEFPKAFLFMPIIGLPMLFLFWPWLWYDGIDHMGRYMSFHLGHEHYFQMYFGQAQQAPPFPFSVPFVLTLTTVPVLTLLLFLVGSLREFLLVPAAWVLCWMRRIRGRRVGHSVPPQSDGVALERAHSPMALPEPTWVPMNWGDAMGRPFGRAAFVLINLLFPVLIIAMPNTPIFGGVKHWLLAMPFLVLLAGSGFVWLVEKFLGALGGLSFWMRSAVGIVLLVAVVAPSVRDALKYVSFGTAYYNELVGGIRGAADLKAQRQFWSYANRQTLDTVNREAPFESRVDFQDATTGACEMYKREGWLRHDLRCAVRIHAPEVMLFDVEERFTEEEQRYWKQMNTIGPVLEAAVEGVPMVRAYVKNAGFSFMEKRIDDP